MDGSFERKLDSLDALFRFTERFASQCRMDKGTSQIIDLVIEELFTNLVKYDAGADVMIPISLKREGNKVFIDIINHGGHEFDIMAAPAVDVEAPLERRKIGGLGLHLVCEMTDDIIYEYAEGTSRIRVVKYLEEDSV